MQNALYCLGIILLIFINKHFQHSYISVAREERKQFIRGKYISKKYVTQTCGGDKEALSDELGQAIRSCNIVLLLQLFAEGADLSARLPSYVSTNML